MRYTYSAPSGPARWFLLALAALTLFLLLRPPPPSETGETEDVSEMLKMYPTASEAETDTEVLGIGRHSATVIFLHGLGGSAAMVFPLVEVVRPKLWQVSWLLPNSPLLPITAAEGKVAPAWFDIDSFPESSDLEPPLPTHEDETAMKKAVDRVHKLIQGELDKGIDSDRIVLAGFSQGCAISLLASLSSTEQLGGVMCMSGWLPLADQIKNGKHPYQKPHAHNVPVWMGHGDKDQTIRHSWGLKTLDLLHALAFRDVEFHTYSGLTHWTRADELQDMRKWLQKRLPPT
ncbi:acyl-protein thioesterase 1 [Rhodotorula toruloides]|uniref:Acyl-protein thioesterase 1 n=1 Tax=Rhodotorula toruloides TaxID=5286 RepID=A0A511KBG6_RHOTO|nr:acyl-protein thioesterase 1 [Rhodotorula toruloides]